ncbi:hypothetical protein C8J55DRAFT_560601 [Lentinula edodes]|uniref:Zn(2)-C6 fungal-type domain-containing protein n=1 Tax=Lentinula lateritia TaxID=40482 RepID=A0A9W9AE58_9AGAR|nr:hypothetical protein C8J55DRAFT_560601 [Lentinula edodes]
MAAIEQRGAFTDPWGREFLSDGTLIKGKEGEEDEAADDSSEDQLSDDNEGPAKKAEPVLSTSGSKTLPKIKLKVTPNFDGPESEEETGGGGGSGNGATSRPPPSATAPLNSTLGGKTVLTTKSKAKEVLSIRDPPCWRCKTLNKPCESSSLRFSCTTCYKRHWACSMNPPPPRQKKGGGGGGSSSHHSAPPKTRSLPVLGTTEAGISAPGTGESISSGPITRGRSPLRSASSKGVKRPRSTTPPPAVGVTVTMPPSQSGPSGISGVLAPQNKKTRTSLRTITKPQSDAQVQSQSQRSQSQRITSKVSIGGGGVSITTPVTSNQGFVRPISTATPAISAQTQNQTSTLTLSEIKSLKSQVDTLIQRDEKSQAVLDQHSAMLDAVLVNMRLLLGDKFVDVHGKEDDSRSPPVQQRKEKGIVEDGNKDRKVSSSAVVQDVDQDELDELDELTPIEKLTPTPLNGIGGSTAVTATNTSTMTLAASKSPVPPPSGLIGPAVAGSYEPQRVDPPPRLISVPSGRVPVQAPVPIKAAVPAPIPIRDTIRDVPRDLPRDSAAHIAASIPSTHFTHINNGIHTDKLKLKPKAKNPYPNISPVLSAPVISSTVSHVAHPPPPPPTDNPPRAIISSARMVNPPPNIPAISTLPAPATPLSPASTTSAVDDEEAVDKVDGVDGIDRGYVADASHGPTPVITPALIPRGNSDREYRSRSPPRRSRSPLPGRAVREVHNFFSTSRHPLASHGSHLSHRSSHTSRPSFKSLASHAPRRLSRSPPPPPGIRRPTSVSRSPTPPHIRYGYPDPYRAQQPQQSNDAQPSTQRHHVYSPLPRSRSRSPYSRSPPPYAHSSLPTHPPNPSSRPSQAPRPLHARDNTDMHIGSLVEPYPDPVYTETRDSRDHVDHDEDRLGRSSHPHTGSPKDVQESRLEDTEDIRDLNGASDERLDRGGGELDKGNSSGRGDEVDGADAADGGEMELEYPSDEIRDTGVDTRDAGDAEQHPEDDEDMYYPEEARYSSSR